MSEINGAQNQPEEVKNVSTEPSTVDSSEALATPPVEANSTLEQDEQRVPYSRFREVIDEKNSLGNRIAELESQLQEMAESHEGPSAYDRALERFRKQGLDETAAKVLADSVQEMANEVAEKRVSKVEKMADLQETTRMVDDFAQTHPDAERYVPLMMDILESYPKQTQGLLSSDPVGLELLYAKAKEFLVDDQIEQARQEGIELGQQGLATKKAISGASGRGSSRVEAFPDPEQIPGMPDEDYMKMRKTLLSPMYAEYVAKKRKGG
jgi:hypothetical protein